MQDEERHSKTAEDMSSIACPLKEERWELTVVTGGQTGVDRAAMDVALELNLPLKGWCPRGRLAEDGLINSKYALQETPTAEYSQRTEWNVRDSDGTLILCLGDPEGGTQLTIDFARLYKKPWLLLQLPEQGWREVEGASDLAVQMMQQFSTWINVHGIKLLNIAGHRESYCPGQVYARTSALLRYLLSPKGFSSS